MSLQKQKEYTWYKLGKVPFYQTLRSYLERKGIKDIEKFIGPRYEKDGWPRNIGEGISFVPRDYNVLLENVKRSNLFFEDDRSTPTGKLALSKTTGRGFRSKGSPSIHIALTSYRVNIHLDKKGFVLVWANGKLFMARTACNILQMIF